MHWMQIIADLMIHNKVTARQGKCFAAGLLNTKC